MSYGTSPQERKKEILDIAAELFIRKGYDHTTTGDILERAGIARGTLYYHFHSKEEILDALVERIIAEVEARVREVAAVRQPAAQKLAAFIQAMKVDSAIGREISDYMHKPQNALLHQKMNASFLAVLCPYAADIIREGVAEGIFETDYPEEAAELMLVSGSALFDDSVEMTEEEAMQKTVAFVYHMERMLGVSRGTFDCYIRQMFGTP